MVISFLKVTNRQVCNTNAFFVRVRGRACRNELNLWHDLTNQWRDAWDLASSTHAYNIL